MALDLDILAAQSDVSVCNLHSDHRHLPEFPDHVASRRVFTNEKLRLAEGRVEDTVAQLNGASHLGGCFPNYLCEMRRLRVIWIVFS